MPLTPKSMPSPVYCVYEQRWLPTVCENEGRIRLAVSEELVKLQPQSLQLPKKLMMCCTLLVELWLAIRRLDQRGSGPALATVQWR